VPSSLTPRALAGLLADPSRMVAPGPEVAYDRLRELAADLIPPDPDPTGLQPFVHGRQLRSLPAQSSRRRVLEHVAAQTFRPDESYDEPAVNELLTPW
jgi:hypothetical protein